MSPRFVLGRGKVQCVAEVVNRSLKADCTDFTFMNTVSCDEQHGLYGIVLTYLSDDLEAFL